jgi:hypothetical protein
VSDLPAEITALVGQNQYKKTATFPVELSYSYNTLSATENGNPLYWDAAVADELTGGMTVPPSTMSLWMRPHRWEPGATEEQVALQVHFDLKEQLGLPEAIMSDNTLILHEPVRPGDVISHHQVLRSISGEKTTKLGTGRFWVIDIEYHNQRDELVGIESYTGFGYSLSLRDRDASGVPLAQKPTPVARPSLPPAVETLPELAYDVTATTVVLGAVASRDWRPMHHDFKFATERNGTQDIFLNTPNLAAWFERYITDWTGPRGRIGRMTFRMRDSVYPDDQMVFSGRVSGTNTDDASCEWAEIDITVSVGERLCCTCTARVAIPTDNNDNPWARKGDHWTP